MYHRATEKGTAMKINDAIRAMLDSRSYSYSDLASKLGVTVQTVSGYVNGQHVNGVHKYTAVSADTAYEIADALGYRLAFVPDTRKLPEGSIAVDGRLTERRASRRSNRDAE